MIIVISLHFLRVCFAKFLKIPELKYDWVYRLAREYPDLQFSLNGGVKTLEDAINLLNPDLHDGIQLNSVMIGRAAWHNPWIFSDADRYNIQTMYYIYIKKNNKIRFYNNISLLYID